MNIVCVGDCGIDHYVASNERRPGGITVNFALQARRCFAAGDNIRIIAPLGKDAAAHIVRDRLDGSGIECHFSVMPGNTPVQFIELESSGERKFVRYEEGVLRQFRIEGDAAACIRNADLVVAPVFEQNREMFASLMAVPKQGVTAIDFADFAEHADFGFLNDTFGQIDIGFFGLQSDRAETIEALRVFSGVYDVLVVVTLGAAGSRAFHDGHVFECAARPVSQVVDTTGAGDAFAAGFLAIYSRTSDIDAALSAGAEVAATVVQQHGATFFAVED